MVLTALLKDDAKTIREKPIHILPTNTTLISPLNNKNVRRKIQNISLYQNLITL